MGNSRFLVDLIHFPVNKIYVTLVSALDFARDFVNTLLYKLKMSNQLVSRSNVRGA